jgi:mono/diheme cytochrome c family protein
MRSAKRRIGATLGSLGLLLAALAAAPDPAAAQNFDLGKFPQQSGEELFRNVCQGCHMPDARGAAGAGTYPALAANPRLAAAVYPLTIVLHGQRAMPPFAAQLDDQQVANVINYVRTHFGNRYKDQITPTAVAARRAALASEAAPAEPPGGPPAGRLH